MLPKKFAIDSRAAKPTAIPRSPAGASSAVTLIPQMSSNASISTTTTPTSQTFSTIGASVSSYWRATARSMIPSPTDRNFQAHQVLNSVTNTATRSATSDEGRNDTSAVQSCPVPVVSSPSASQPGTGCSADQDSAAITIVAVATRRNSRSSVTVCCGAPVYRSTSRSTRQTSTSTTSEITRLATICWLATAPNVIMN